MSVTNKTINWHEGYAKAIKEWKGTIRKDRTPQAIFNEDQLQYMIPDRYKCPICKALEKPQEEFLTESEMMI